MPGFNQTGPDGAGKMTGWQRGMCRRTEDGPLGAGASGRGGGIGNRSGGGRGRCRAAGLMQDRSLLRGSRSSQIQQKSATDEQQQLRQQYEAAKKVLKSIEEKIAALDSHK